MYVPNDTYAQIYFTDSEEESKQTEYRPCISQAILSFLYSEMN